LSAFIAGGVEREVGLYT